MGDLECVCDSWWVRFNPFQGWAITTVCYWYERTYKKSKILCMWISLKTLIAPTRIIWFGIITSWLPTLAAPLEKCILIYILFKLYAHGWQVWNLAPLILVAGLFSRFILKFHLIGVGSDPQMCILSTSTSWQSRGLHQKQMSAAEASA
jgi:hypothetical protein